MTLQRVGNRSVTVAQAQAWLTSHTSGANADLNGWKNYDLYQSGTSETEIGEADLLAPGQLNVSMTLANLPSLKARPQDHKAAARRSSHRRQP